MKSEFLDMLVSISAECVGGCQNHRYKKYIPCDSSFCLSSTSYLLTNFTHHLRKEQLKEDGLHHATECLQFPGASHSSLRESLPQQYYRTLYVRTTLAALWPRLNFFPNPHTMGIFGIAAGQTPSKMDVTSPSLKCGSWKLPSSNTLDMYDRPNPGA
jgi:hypothetical protein